MISEKFNSYFTEVTEDLSQANTYNPQQYLRLQVNDCLATMFVASVTESEVIRAIKGLKNNSSAGFDEIPTFQVKQCLYHFIKPLVHIYNISFQTGTFPDLMKKAKVKPLLKKKDKHDMQNYRPISILSVFSKPLEKLMHNRLIFKKKNITYYPAIHMDSQEPDPQKLQPTHSYKVSKKLWTSIYMQ